MRMHRTIRLAALAATAMLAVAACGNAGSSDDDSAKNTYEVVKDPSFESGSRMAAINKAGKVKIGVKFDQPGVGYKTATSKTPTGFDPEMGKIIAGQLGLKPSDIQWVETVSDNREPFLQKGTVDFVIASYSITDERRQVVGQAGPYYVTGQSLLVAKDDDSIKGPDDLEGKKVCSVTGSTSIATVEEKYGAKPAGFDTYSECVDQLKNGSVDAVTTDGAILLGYAAQAPDKLKVVGEPFSEERYGVGFSKKYPELCSFLNTAIEKSFSDGDWKKAFDSTLGKSGNDAPETPKVDGCSS